MKQISEFLTEKLYSDEDMLNSLSEYLNNIDESKLNDFANSLRRFGKKTLFAIAMIASLGVGLPGCKKMTTLEDTTSYNIEYPIYVKYDNGDELCGFTASEIISMDPEAYRDMSKPERWREIEKLYNFKGPDGKIYEYKAEYGNPWIWYVKTLSENYPNGESYNYIYIPVCPKCGSQSKLGKYDRTSLGARMKTVAAVTPDGLQIVTTTTGGMGVGPNGPTLVISGGSDDETDNGSTSHYEPLYEIPAKTYIKVTREVRK